LLALIAGLENCLLSVHWIGLMPPEDRNLQNSPTHSADNNHVLLVWLLLDNRPGHATQVKGLAHKMGWATVSIDLKFNYLNRLPNPLLGSGLLSLDRADRQKLQAPYPDIVVGMGRRIVPVARWIKRQSGGATRIVLLGRKAMGKASDIDFVVSCVHFNQMPRERVFELVVPPTQVNSESLAVARETRPDPISTLKHPRIVLLAGGPTAQHRFDATDAIQLVSTMMRAASKLGGELAIVTSRRTPSGAVEAIQRMFPNVHLHVWSKDAKENPYLSYLAQADLLVATGESESMIAEAAAAGLPLTIYPLQAKPQGMKNYLANALRHKAVQDGLLASLCRSILLAGWIVPPRNLALMHSAMVKGGMASVFDGSLNTQSPLPSGEIEVLARQLDSLLTGKQ
jgi:uncharacterized protein